MAAACASPVATQDSEQETEMNSDWFTRGEWRQGWSPSPDESIDREEFARQYQRQPEAWKAAFRFLREQDLAALPVGRYELDGADLFVNVDEYLTKNEEDTRFEAHRQYIDIQYLVSGSEKIGVIPLYLTTVVEPYDEERDITFLEARENNYRLASPDNFLVFFPQDAHRPGVKADKNIPIRKVVVKIRFAPDNGE